MEQPGQPGGEAWVKCHQSMAQIHHAIAQVDGLVLGLLRRAGRGEASSPEWIHLHELLKQELELVRAEGILPESMPVELNLLAPKDLLFGVYSDFTEVVGHLIGHALEGLPRQISIRTWGGDKAFGMEVEDDGAPIEAGLLDDAFEPFLDLRPEKAKAGRRPGQGLSACAQLMNTYGGTVQIIAVERGSRVRISLPME
jgi:signal transduction histidine kinase